MLQLTQKENSYLEDEKNQEQICIEKYNKYANEASSVGLKSLFQTLGQQEQTHLNSINQILSGTVPQVGSGNQSSQQQQSGQQSTTTQQSSGQTANNNPNDSYLCTDALSTEKHVSSVYNTSIFEFRDPSIRQVLNHIQKEEQEHGLKIYEYMAQNGMYNAGQS